MIGEIAAQERIPRKFLEQILLELKRHGILMSKRGKLGGYALLMRRRPDHFRPGFAHPRRPAGALALPQPDCLSALRRLPHRGGLRDQACLRRGRQFCPRGARPHHHRRRHPQARKRGNRGRRGRPLRHFLPISDLNATRALAPGNNFSSPERSLGRGGSRCRKLWYGPPLINTIKQIEFRVLSPRRSSHETSKHPCRRRGHDLDDADGERRASPTPPFSTFPTIRRVSSTRRSTRPSSRTTRPRPERPSRSSSPTAAQASRLAPWSTASRPTS